MNKMENYFATLFEHVRHETSLKLLLCLTDSDKKEQTALPDQEIIH